VYDARREGAIAARDFCEHWLDVVGCGDGSRADERAYDVCAVIGARIDPATGLAIVTIGELAGSVGIGKTLLRRLLYRLVARGVLHYRPGLGTGNKSCFRPIIAGGRS
jgi:hypothetical protein